MTVLKAKAKQTSAITRLGEGADVYLRALRDGSVISADWRHAAIMGGRGFMGNTGALSDGKKGGGSGTVLVIDQPEVLLSIPNGTSILPMRIGVHIQPGAPTITEEVELLIAVDQDAAWDLAGTSSLMPIYNMNTLSARASQCTGRNAFTATITTAPILDLELARKVMEFDVQTQGITAMEMDLVYEPKALPIINGPAMLLVYWGGTKAVLDGYCDLQWLEFPEGTFSV